MLKISKYSLVVALLLFASCTPAENDESGESGQYDETAIAHLDALTEAIGALNSCSFTLFTSTPELSKEYDVYMRGPDKMYFHAYDVDSGAEISHWYDGSDVSFYSYESDTYGTVAAPDNILATIDFLSELYGMDFPAGDFFYPSLTDDIIDDFTNVWLAGEESVGEIETVLIQASNDDQNLSIWIDKSTNFPYRMVLDSSGEGGEYYDAVFANWQVDPFLPDRMFEFSPPSSAEQVDFK